MKISMFALADYVTVGSGKLTIVGVFDRLNSVEFPFVAPPFGIALKGYVEKGDYGQTRTITIEIKSLNKKITLFEANADVVFPQKRPRPIDAMTLKFMLANIEFKSPGVYVVECKIGKKILSTIHLDVVKSSAAGDSRKVAKKVVKKKTAKKVAKKKVSKKNQVIMYAIKLHFVQDDAAADFLCEITTYHRWLNSSSVGHTVRAILAAASVYL